MNLFDYVESQLPADGFIFGKLGIADIAVATAIINATYTEFDVDGGRWPKLSDHLGLVKAHPTVAKCMRTEEPLIAALKDAKEQRQAQAG